MSMKAVEGGMSANATYALQVMAIDVAKAVGEQSASNQSRHPPSSAPAGEDRRVSDGRGTNRPILRRCTVDELFLARTPNRALENSASSTRDLARIVRRTDRIPRRTSMEEGTPHHG